jgi:hypothetical protein
MAKLIVGVSRYGFSISQIYGLWLSCLLVGLVDEIGRMDV